MLIGRATRFQILEGEVRFSAGFGGDDCFSDA
jgi:hypothetical protein